MEQRLPSLSEKTERGQPWLILIALFLTVIGARLWLISGYGSALPLHDQWDAEAAHLLKPWLENSLRWSDLFAPHNEHRMVLSRVLALGVFEVNGQWDALLEITVNAVLSALYGVGIAAGLLSILGSQHRVSVLVAVTLWLTLPFGHENTLWTFHAFHFLLFFSFIAIWGLGFHPSYSRNWWVGVVAAVLACFSTASGFFAGGVILLLETMRLLSKRRRLIEVAPTCLLAIAVIAVGLSLRVNYPPHEALKAASTGAWIRAFAGTLAWPYPTIPVLMFVMYVPLAISTFFMTKPSTPEARARREILFALGVWDILQAAAIAYARGENGNVPIAARYMDILALGVVVNALCVVALLKDLRWTAARRSAALVWGAIWIIASVSGAAALGFQKLASPGHEALLPMEENVRAYVATHDPKYLAGDRPYPDAARLGKLLDDPTIRNILPTIVRPAVPIVLREETGGAFVSNGYPAALLTPPYEKAWGSYSQSEKEARGRMETESFHSAFPYLEFDVAGALRDGNALSLRDATGKAVQVNSPARPNENWRSAVVPVPGSNVHIVAADDSTTRWFAFREPRELARLGNYARLTVAKGKYIFMFGVAIFTLTILNALRSSSRLEPPRE